MSRVAAAQLRAHSWGFTELEIERDLLGIGKLGLRRAARCVPGRHSFRDAGRRSAAGAVGVDSAGA